MCAVGCKNRFSAKCADCLQPDGIGGFHHANFAEDESTHVTISSTAVGAEKGDWDGEVVESAPKRNCDRFHGADAANDALVEFYKESADTSRSALVKWMLSPCKEGVEEKQ